MPKKSLRRGGGEGEKRHTATDSLIKGRGEGTTFLDRGNGELLYVGLFENFLEGRKKGRGGGKAPFQPIASYGGERGNNAGEEGILWEQVLLQ